MKTLCLVRHAKASQVLQLQDIDRPLVERGYNDAHFLSNKLMANGYKPQAMVTSAGIRALSTALVFARNLHFPAGKIQISEKLYNASVEQVMQVIYDIAEELDHVMVFGHNPSITNCTNLLLDDFIEHVPTCGISCIKFDVKSWDQVKPKSGTLQFFDYPKNN